MELEPLLTTDEVATYLRVEVVTIRRLINRGELPAYRVGGEFRFMHNELVEYLQKQRFSGNNEQKEALDRFTLRARKVLDLAQEEARNFKHNYVGTEHILLGVLRESEGWIATQMLLQQNVEPQKIRMALNAILTRGDTPPGEAEAIGLTPRSKKAIVLAGEEARELGHNYVGTEHILLGLVREGDGIAATLLTKFGVTLEKSRTLLVEQLNALKNETAIPPVPSEAATLVHEGESVQTCPRCHAQSPGYFRHCFNCGLLIIS